MKEQIVICMPVKNAEQTIETSIESVLNQKYCNRNISLLIGYQPSVDGTWEVLKKYDNHPNIHILHSEATTIVENRNFLLNQARNIPLCSLIGRLDADDFILQDDSIAQIEAIYDDECFDIFLCGNRQHHHKVSFNGVNYAQKDFLNKSSLLKRLEQMSLGRKEAELPSCNTFIHPKISINYPEVQSAEDHWWLVELLCSQHKHKIVISEELLYCSYNIGGLSTQTNVKSNLYLSSRKDLYEHFKRQLQD